MKTVGSRVAYRKIRETQHVPRDLRDAEYTVEDNSLNADDEPIVLVRSPWGTATWIFDAWLDTVPPSGTLPSRIPTPR